MSMAFSANLKEFLSHTACQTLISELWLGGIRSHKYVGIKVIIGYLMFNKKRRLNLLIFIDIIDIGIFSNNFSNSI